MTIRRAAPADIDAMAALLAELFEIEDDFMIDSEKQKRGLSLLLEDAEAVVLVAEVGGSVAAQAASDTPSIAFAPRRVLFGVPSSSMRILSIYGWSSALRPLSASAISPLTFSTAFCTPLPR